LLVRNIDAINFSGLIAWNCEDEWNLARKMHTLGQEMPREGSIFLFAWWRMILMVIVQLDLSN
jgi:hypothetical protein